MTEHYLDNTSLLLVLLEIEGALKAHLYYLALMSTLTLPDICAALEDKDGRTNQTKFEAWYNKHLAPHYGFLTASDCYGLRCGVTHQGIIKTDTTRQKSQHKRVLFMLPNTQAKYTNSQFIDSEVYVTDLVEFCRDVVARVKAWARAENGNPVVKANAARLMHYYHEGLEPITGLPLFS
jgi:hypothetical protein